MSFLERKTTRITGNKPQNDRRNSTIGGGSSGQVPNAKKPRSRPAKSLRDRLPFPQGTLPPSSGPYSIANMEIEVPVENPRTISDIKRDGRHLLQLETVLFTMYYPAAFGSGEGQDPAGHKHWSRETWLPRPRMQTARGYAHFAGIPDWTLISFLGATSMLTKLRGFRNSPPAKHWPPSGNYKQNGYKIKNQEGPPPEGHDGEPVFPLLMFSHGLGGTRTAYSSLCSEFASYGFVVCAVEHRDGSGPRTFVNHRKQDTRSKDHKGGAKANKADCEGDKDCEAEWGRWKDVDHTEEELRKGHHNIDYIFPKGNRMDTAPNNEQGVDQELRNAQIELRLCELEEAYNVLKKICSGDGEEVARQNLRSEGFVGGSSRGLKGVNWEQWKKRFHIDKMTIAGHSFGAATVVEVLRHTDRFKNVQAGIIYDIWGAPIKPPAEAPEHRIHLPLLGINSEAFMYWQQNFDAVMSLMKETKESGAPAYLLTVRGSVHISQSDFSLLYRGITELLMKATVHPQRAIDLNISASLEFLRLVAPDAGAGKSLINRAMTDEGLLGTELLEEVPDEHRPTDQWIAARLKVPHEFRTRLTTGVQRHFKQKNKTGEAKYTTGDEIWMHFKPTATELQKWIRDEDRGENRIDSNHAMKSGAEAGNPATHELHGDKDGSKGNGSDVSNDATASAKHSYHNESHTSGDKSGSTQPQSGGFKKFLQIHLARQISFNSFIKKKERKQMAEKNVAYTYSQLESQNDQIPAATEPTAIEWCMMRRAAKWVYFISLFQIIFGIFCIIGAGGFLIGLLSVIFGSFGLSGARKRNIRYLTAHFVFTLAMYILALVSIVLMIIYCDRCPFFIYIIAFLFQILLAVGMRHSRIFIALLKLYPQYQNTIATCHRNKNNTPVAVPMEVSTQTNIQSEQQIPMQFYPQMVAIPQQHVQGAAPLMTMAPIRYQQPFIQPMNGYPMYQQPNFPMGMQPYFAPFPVAPVQVQPPQDNNNNINNSNSLYPNNNIPGVYRQV